MTGGSVPEKYATPPPAVMTSIQQGNALFKKKDYREAAGAYAKGLETDPHYYYSALWTGDCYFSLGDTEHAGVWFARAIQIDPNVETAYRYWGDALLKAGRRDESKEKYVLAFVSDPYLRRSWDSLSKWSKRFNGQPTNANPFRELTMVAHREFAHVSYYWDKNALARHGRPTRLSKADGTTAWLEYDRVHREWLDSKFAKNFPGERYYWHSFDEEREALIATTDAVLNALESGEVKEESVDQLLVELLRLRARDLLEPHIFYALGNSFIAQDYAAYKAQHAKRLAAYVDSELLGK